jgi:hypothetical protein
MIDEKLDEAIQNIEAFYFGEGGSIENGEKLYIDFAKQHKNEFIKSKLSESTENKFEYVIYISNFL